MEEDLPVITTKTNQVGGLQLLQFEIILSDK